MKRKSFTNSVSQMVLNIYKTVAWADIVARVSNGVSPFLVHWHLIGFAQLFANQAITPPEEMCLNNTFAVEYLEATSKTSAVTAPSKNPQNTSSHKVPPPLPVDHVLSLHHVTALSFGICCAVSVTLFLYLP